VICLCQSRILEENGRKEIERKEARGASVIVSHLLRYFRKETLWPTSADEYEVHEHDALDRVFKLFQSIDGNLNVHGLMSRNNVNQEKEIHPWVRIKAKSRKETVMFRVLPEEERVEVYGRTKIAGNILDVASKVCFSEAGGKFLKAVNGHSNIFETVFHLQDGGKRKHVYLQTRRETIKGKMFVIAHSDLEEDHDDYDEVTKGKTNLLKANGGVVLEKINDNKCTLTILTSYDAGGLGFGSDSLDNTTYLEGQFKKIVEGFLWNLKQSFKSKSERARVEQILKAREHTAEINWRDSVDELSTEEETILAKADVWLNNVSQNLDLWTRIEHSDDVGVVMMRNSIVMKGEPLRNLKAAKKLKETIIEKCDSQGFGREIRNSLGDKDDALEAHEALLAARQITRKSGNMSEDLLSRRFTNRAAHDCIVDADSKNDLSENGFLSGISWRRHPFTVRKAKAKAKAKAKKDSEGGLLSTRRKMFASKKTNFTETLQNGFMGQVMKKMLAEDDGDALLLTRGFMKSGRRKTSSKKKSLRKSSERSAKEEGLTNSNDTIHMGYCAATIDAPFNLIKAWYMDDYGDKGLREEAGEAEAAKRKLEVVNDHHFIEYRRVQGTWPFRDRSSVLKHVAYDWSADTFICATLPAEYEDVEEEDKVVRTQYAGVFKLTKLGENLCYAQALFSLDDPGMIPTWVVQNRTHTFLRSMVVMKSELSEKTLASKILTFDERINKLRRRMGLKWVEESILEKTAIFIGAGLSKYLFELGWTTVFIGFFIIAISEVVSDILTVLVCSKYLDIKMTADNVKMNMVHVSNRFISLLTPSLCGLVGFILVAIRLEEKHFKEYGNEHFEDFDEEDFEE